jgi:hypothetical protein
MAYLDIFNAANDAAFQGRCLVAMWKSAQDIANEADTTPNHQARKDWSVRVLQDRANITPRQVAMQVLTNAVIASAPDTASDSDIQYQVNASLNAIIAIG